MHTHTHLSQVLLMHNNQNSEQIAEQTDENKLSILSLATLQGEHAVHQKRVQLVNSRRACTHAIPTPACIPLIPPGDIRMVKWITSTFTQLGHISDKKGNLPIHFAAAAGLMDRWCHLFGSVPRLPPTLFFLQETSLSSSIW